MPSPPSPSPPLYPPYSLPGPPVSSRPTTLTILHPTHLRTPPYSRFLPSIRRTVNAAFEASRLARADISRSDEPRLEEDGTILRQLGADGGTFVVVLHWALPEGEGGGEGEGEGKEEVLGTAAARRNLGPVEGVWYHFMREGMPKEGWEEWELKLLTVEPGFQGRGLAGLLMGVVEKEVGKKFAGMGEGKGNGARVVLSAVKELQEGFYARRGYEWEYEKERGDGFNFHIAYMAKELGEGR